MRRSLAFALALAALLTGVTWLVYGQDAAISSAKILGPLGVGTVAAIHLLRSRRRRIGGLRRQFSLIALVAVVQLFAGVALMVDLMFVSDHDAFFAAIIAVNACALAVWAARLSAREALGELDAIRGTLAAVGEGRRDMRCSADGRDEIAALAQDVNAMIERLDREESARRNLIGAVSHDLRTPITSLRLISDALGDELIEPERRHEYLRRMSTHVSTLVALIDDLFELTRLEAGDLSWSIQAVELDELISETVEAMRPQADASAVAMETQLAGSPLSARANPEQLQRVLFNLIQNAIRHTPADGTITVRAEQSDRGVEVEVHDTGAGITPTDRERVFDTFFRGGSQRSRNHDGAGLGLSISRAIIEAHGGQIWLEDATRGTRVRFRVPGSA